MSDEQQDVVNRVYNFTQELNKALKDAHLIGLKADVKVIQPDVLIKINVRLFELLRPV